MAMVYRYIGILTVNVVTFFRSPGIFQSQDSFPSTFHPRLWETSSGVVAVGVFAAEARSFSNLPVTSPTSQLILQPFCCFTYVTAHSPILLLLHLHHSSFSNPFFASPTSQALHLMSPRELPMAYRLYHGYYGTI